MACYRANFTFRNTLPVGRHLRVYLLKYWPASQDVCLSVTRVFINYGYSRRHVTSSVCYVYMFLCKDSYVRALINNSYNKANKRSDVKIIFLQEIYQNSDMFRSILIIFRDLSNISKAYIKTWMGY